MPSNLKNLVRARMAKTGERYQMALRHVRESAPRSLESVPASEAPKLLLDTNIYLDLAAGRLAGHRERLVNVAAYRTPPLFWACETTFEELVCHIHPENATEYEKYWTALRWMERLCGGRGITEDQKWVLRSGVFAEQMPCDVELGAALVSVRRGIIKAKRFEDLPARFLSTIETLRADSKERIDSWVAGRTKVGLEARVKPQPGESRADGSDLIADAVLEVSRKHALANGSGVVRSDEEQKREQRELIAIEKWFLQQARNPQPYNHEKHRSDYNDYWLCAYPAAGYTLVTTDGRLRNAIKEGGCNDPRLKSLDDGLALAEKWLAKGR